MRNMTLKQHTEEVQMKLEVSKSFVTAASIRCYVCVIVINGSCFFLFFFSELDSERRALEESEREKRLLASRVEDLSGRLELSERERREVCQVIND